MLRIGLTGGIGSGKSTVAKMFAELGAPIIDSDVIARELFSHDPEVKLTIQQHFGADISREKLREIIFADPKEKTWLEELLHPLIIARIQAETAKLDAAYCIIVIPLLFEKKLEYLVDRILLVDVPEAVQRERVLVRDQSKLETIAAMMTSQVSRQQRLNGADDVIENVGSIADTRLRIMILHQNYTVGA